MIAASTVSGLSCSKAQTPDQSILIGGELPIEPRAEQRGLIRSEDGPARDQHAGARDDFTVDVDEPGGFFRRHECLAEQVPPGVRTRRRFRRPR